MRTPSQIISTPILTAILGLLLITGAGQAIEQDAIKDSIVESPKSTSPYQSPPKALQQQSISIVLTAGVQNNIGIDNRYITRQDIIRELRGDISAFLGEEDYTILPSFNQKLMTAIESKLELRARGLLKINETYKTNNPNSKNGSNHNGSIHKTQLDKALEAHNRLSNTYHIDYLGTNSQSAVITQKLARHPLIAHSEILPNHTLSATSLPNDTLYPEQNYLPAVNAQQAWAYVDSLQQLGQIDTTVVITVAVVDTGFDLFHADMLGAFGNIGEMGYDANGLDKSKNNKDDDSNGYIDDFLGWDFNSSLSEQGDNDPSKGHDHGMHVAGVIAANRDNITGIAGLANQVRILPVKIGVDDRSDRSIDNVYQALLYAAASEADFINCSWGSDTPTRIGKDAVEVASALGSLVIAAAGNEGQDEPFYPASFKQALSVASTDSKGQRPGFSNYNYTVDISAPGMSVMSTVHDGLYKKMSGTSMSTPIVSGIASLLHLANPDLNNNLLKEVIIGNSQPHIDKIPSSFNYKIGSGMADASAAVRESKKDIFAIEEVSILNNPKLISSGDRITLSISGKTLQGQVDDLGFAVEPLFGITTSLPSYHGAAPQGIPVQNSEISLDIDNLPYDYAASVLVYANSQSTPVDYEPLNFTINPSFRQLTNGSIDFSGNSQGNLGYNDYPNNQQGVGFNLQGVNHLFESGIIIATSETKVINNLRGDFAGSKDNDFVINDIITIDSSSNDYWLAKSSFSDRYPSGLLADMIDTFAIGLKVEQTVILPRGEASFAILVYDLTNNKAMDFINGNYASIDSLYFGAFYDWDISQKSNKDAAYFDLDKNGIIFVDATKYADGEAYRNPNSAKAFVKLISGGETGCFVMDNIGGGEFSPGIYDGFLRREKYKLVSEGKSRLGSSVTDVSGVVSSGPHYLEYGDTVRLVYAVGLVAQGERIGDLDDEVMAFVSENESLVFGGSPEKEFSLHAYPNPLQPQSKLILSNNRLSTFDIALFDSDGRLVHIVADGQHLGKGKYSFILPNLATGVYYAKVSSAGEDKSLQLIME